MDINFSTEIFFSNEKLASAIGKKREWKSGLAIKLRTKHGEPRTNCDEPKQTMYIVWVVHQPNEPRYA